MPNYKIRFFVECSIVADKDAEFCYADHSVRFFFSTRKPDDKGCSAEISCDGANWKDAVDTGINEIIPSILDIVAFHCHSPMMLSTPTRVLKSEPGMKRRKAILINKKTFPVTHRLQNRSVDEINKALASEPAVPRTVLRWLRNSYRTIPILDRFVFAWLSLENLGGDKRVEKNCPNCGFSLPPYTSADRQAAFAILKEVDAEIQEKEFSSWWNGLRNRVFHGGKEPDSDFLGKLRATSDRILSALNEFVARRLRFDFAARSKVPVADEKIYFRHHFIEFDSPEGQTDFPAAVPEAEELEAIIDRQGNPASLMKTEILNWSETEGW